MLAGTYEIHHEKDDADITPGDRFSLDWGISQFLPLNKDQTLLGELGIAGYSQWQVDVDEDSGSNVIQALNVKDKVPNTPALFEMRQIAPLDFGKLMNPNDRATVSVTPEGGVGDPAGIAMNGQHPGVFLILTSPGTSFRIMLPKQKSFIGNAFQVQNFELCN